MAIQAFTSGQTLTAANMTTLQQNDYNWTTSAQTASYVLVAADAGKTITMTNAGATTITVNTSLFTAGDTVRIINLGAGACTITAGTATVNTAGSLVLPQYGSGTLWFSSASAAIFIPDDRNAGLTLIKTQTIGSAVSSVTVTDAFSATYDNYRVIVTGGSASTSLTLALTLGSTATGYYNSGQYTSFGSSTIVGFGNNNATSIALSGDGSADNLNSVIEIYNPFASKTTTFRCTYITNRTAGVFVDGGAFLNNTTSYTAFTLTCSTGTITGGTIRVYGYQNS